MNSGVISALVGVAGLAINAIVLIFLVAQIRLLREQVAHAKDAFVFEQQRQCRQSTLEFMASTMERRHELDDQVPSENSKEAILEFQERARNDPHVLATLWSYLNYYEVLASGVNEGVFDLGVVDRTSGTTIIKIEEFYGDFIKSVREAERRPRVYIEIESLAKTLREQRDTEEVRSAVAVTSLSTPRQSPKAV